MAKEDFCFTYYDGDAARDKAHMTRLERGAYDDIISAQRKRGHLSESDLKKVLGKDFEQCWESIEWILKKDGEGKYYIEWVDTSTKKSAEHSKKQKEKINNYWDKKKELEELRNNNGITNDKPYKDKPLEDGYENGDGDVKENKNGKKCESMIPKMAAEFKRFNTDYPEDNEKDYPALLKIAAFIGKKIDKPFIVNEDFETAMMPYWSQLCQKIPEDKFFKNYSISQVEKYIQSIVLTIQDATGNNTYGKPNSKITADGLSKAHAKYFG